MDTETLTILKKGESIQPEVVITPENGTDKSVDREVQKPDIIEFYGNRTITAKEPGITKITKMS